MENTPTQPPGGASGGSNPQSATNELKHDAENLKETAARQGEAKADQEKERVGRAASSASAALRTAAGELRDDNDAPDWLASAFASVAREVEGVAGRLQNKSTREIASETRRFARDNPTAFLAASAAAGFAAARFLRAGSEYDDDYEVGSRAGYGDGSENAAAHGWASQHSANTMAGGERNLTEPTSPRAPGASAYPTTGGL